MARRKPMYSIKTVVVAVSVLLLTVSIAMSISFLSCFRTQSFETKREQYSYSLNMMYNSVCNDLSVISSELKLICSRADVQEFMESNYESNVEAVQQLCERMKYVNISVAGITFVGSNGRIFRGFGSDQYISQLAGNIAELYPHGFINDGMPYYTLTQEIYDREYSEAIGYAAVIIDCNIFLKSAMAGRVDQSVKYIVAYDSVPLSVIFTMGYVANLPDGLLFQTANLPQQTFDRFTTEKQEFYISQMKADGYGLILYLIVPAVSVTPVWPDELLIYLVMWVCAVGMIIVLLIRLFSAMRYSANRIDRLLEHIDSDDYEQKEAALPISEFSHVVQSINRMSDTIKTLNDKNLLKEKQLLEKELINRQTTLNALKNQINPHFIYNTLSCVKGLSINCGDERISEICSSIIAILRYSIKDIPTAMVSEELKALESYLYIQSCRYPQKFTYKISIDESIVHLQILRFLLQPILENSIIHGLVNAKTNGRILITGKQEDGNIVFKISDSGKGMSPETVSEIIRKMNEAEPPSDGHGIGLVNINHRIRLFYGEEYGVRIESVPNVGTFVTVVLPKIESEE